MVIRLAILLHSRGRGAYETLRKTGVLKLPGSSTLREYTNVMHPREGFRFQLHVQEELQAAADKLEPHKRFVDKRSGELVGFVNRDTWLFEGGREKLATHALTFFAVGINSTIKMSLGFVGTRYANAGELYTLFWQAIGVVEETGLKMIVSTSDKAPADQRLYQMHGHGGEICYKSLNMFSPDRNIYSISDPPHLVKTLRTTCPAVAVERTLNYCGKMVSTFYGDTLLTSTDETLTVS